MGKALAILTYHWQQGESKLEYAGFDWGDISGSYVSLLVPLNIFLAGGTDVPTTQFVFDWPARASISGAEELEVVLPRRLDALDS